MDEKKRKDEESSKELTPKPRQEKAKEGEKDKGKEKKTRGVIGQIEEPMPSGGTQETPPPSDG